MNKILNITAILGVSVILLAMGVNQIRTQSKTLDMTKAMIEQLEAQIDEHQTALKDVPAVGQTRPRTVRDLREGRPLLEVYNKHLENQAITDSISVIMPGTPTWSGLTATEQEQNRGKIERWITMFKDVDRSPTWVSELFLDN